MRRLPLLPIFVSFLVLIAFSSGFAAMARAEDIEADNVIDRLFEDQPDEPWVIEADSLRYDSGLQQYIAEGDVVITKAGRQLTADYVRFDQVNMQAYASGNVVLTMQDQQLEAGTIDLDLESQTGTLTDAYLYVKQDNFHIRGKTISKIGEKTYTIENASVTTCDGLPPDWSIHARKLKVTVDEYGTGRNANFRVRNLPLLWSPFVAFPVKTRRETGLLIPEFGLSDRKGFAINQPLFWAINENTDATLYGYYMSRRGLKLGGEYRYILSRQTKGTWMLDYLDDRRVDDGTGASSQDWGYTGDNFLRPNRDRYWFRGSHYQPVPLGFFSRLDLDVVSDQDYLQEFKTGYSGFDDTRGYFSRAFGREIDDYTETVRLNRLNFNRNWPKFNLDVDFRWQDDVVKRRFDQLNPTVQRLPFIGLDGLKQPVAGSIFYWDTASEYNYFYREDGDKGHRFDLYPRLYLPTSFKNYVSFEPSAGVRGTVWNVDPDPANSNLDGSRETFSRAIYDIRATMSSDFFRTYRFESGSIDRIKHGVRPQILYEYVPEVDQADLPEFDDLDRIEARNLMTYSLINTLTTRRVKPIQPGQDNLPRYDYAELLRFELAQSFDIDEATRDRQPDEVRRPFGPVRADLDLRLSGLARVDATAAWDVYDQTFDSTNIYLTFYNSRRDRFGIDYFYTRDRSESVSLDFLVNLTRRIATTFEYEQNLRTDERLKTYVGLIYTADCWSVDVTYLDEPDDTSIQFMINLFGLGGVGTGGSLP